MTISDIGDVALIINSYKRVSCFKDVDLFKEWSGETFDIILKDIRKKMVDSSQKKSQIIRKLPTLMLDLI